MMGMKRDMMPLSQQLHFGVDQIDREVMHTQTLDKKVTVCEEVERSPSVKYILNFYFSYSRKSMSEA